ncbi:DUF3142 domain-containing protein, partial [Herbaspirillum frisingense]
MPPLPRCAGWRLSTGLFTWLVLTVLLASCSRHPATEVGLAQDVYVWQRQWTPALRNALSASNAHVARWHVLAAELGASGGWVDIQPDVAVL